MIRTHNVTPEASLLRVFYLSCLFLFLVFLAALVLAFIILLFFRMLGSIKHSEDDDNCDEKRFHDGYDITLTHNQESSYPDRQP